ncbi:MAG TPA: hypothetical protein DEA57_06915 [Sulfurihydrogenibium sp.]|uniref:Uncharacterized protein n=1 Tax=Sulfurihydrogenibium yellowstonense SS-5 TaxID=432331 RepID=C4FKM3_9AQUI|nr:hypothetical protein [Sulfurihydrogenibium yellowstonense]EEP60372.1 hypothetical protein SULYE_1123 [Sulfurihydrogenibium yellowstonense SS-5]HBT99183.1 hypothetical protein [Sulfurihydrogenibium sp.]
MKNLLRKLLVFVISFILIFSFPSFAKGGRGGIGRSLDKTSKVYVRDRNSALYELYKDSTSGYIILGMVAGYFLLTIGLATFATFSLTRELKSAKMQNNKKINSFSEDLYLEKINFAELRDDEPITVLKNNFSLISIFAKLLLFVFMLFLAILMTGTTILLIYKIREEPTYYVNYIELVFSIIVSILIIGFLNLSLTLFNLKYIKVYKNKIIQNAFIKWLPPFNRSINLDQKDLKIKIYIAPVYVYHIVFTDNLSLVRNLLSLFSLDFFYPKTIHMFFNTRTKFYSTCSSKDEVLRFINFLLEKIENAEDREKLEELKQILKAW